MSSILLELFAVLIDAFEEALDEAASSSDAGGGVAGGVGTGEGPDATPGTVRGRTVIVRGRSYSGALRGLLARSRISARRAKVIGETSGGGVVSCRVGG